MKLSLSWLEDYIDLSGHQPSELAEKLTMGAFEVEGIEKIGDKLSGEIVLGEIREIAKHPDADKLQITQTCIGKNADGSENIQQIVCGARNIAVGQKVPVATIGSLVVDRHSGGSLEIKKSKIRGIESCGMLCSPDELGYDENNAAAIKAKQGDGIYVLYDPQNPAIEDLAKNHNIGADIRKILGFKVDYVFDIGARSNRGDALSIYGQAREFSALFKIPLKKISPSTNYSPDKNTKGIKPKIENESDCAVFHTAAVENLKVQASPTWLKERLEALGQKSINNLVDISNYVLLELGQPLHFYDRDKISGDSLTARRAKSGERFKALDDREHILSEINLVIADAKGPECLAGVMGGHNTQVTENTTSIVIEAAAFNAATVRRSARSAGVESESKRRFERGVDKCKTETALLRAIELIIKVTQEQNLSVKVGVIESAGSAKIENKQVTLTSSDIKRYLGIELNDKEIIDLLAPLEISIDAAASDPKKDTLVFNIPSHRQNDISRAEDLVEEVGRLYGFDRIPLQAPRSSMPAAIKSEREEISARIQQTLTASGFSQAILSSLVGDTLCGIGEANPKQEELKIEMLNPLSTEHYILRQSLIPGLIQATSRNYAYDKSSNIKLFELGKVYFRNDKAPTKSIEKDKLAAIMLAYDEDWDASKPGQAQGFYNLKNIIENLYPRAKFLAAETLAYSHPGIAAEIKEDGKNIGYLAKLHPSIAKEWDLPDNVYILELDLPKTNKSKFKTIPNTPIIERDLTVDIAAGLEISSEQITSMMRKEAGSDLSGIRLLSSFRRDENSPLSLSYRLKWQSQTETLSGEQIDGLIDSIKNLLESKLGVKFRI